MLRIALAAALTIRAFSALGETVTPENSEPTTDAMKRAEWLKSRPPPPLPRRANFRTSESRAPGLRLPETQAQPSAPPASEAPTPTPAPSKVATASARDGQAPVARTSPSPTPKTRLAEAPSPTPRASVAATSKSSEKASASAATPTPASSKTRLAEAPSPTPRASVAAASKPAEKASVSIATPTPALQKMRIAEAPSPTPRASPAPLSKPTKMVALPTAAPATPAPQIAKFRAPESQPITARVAPPSRLGSDSRYPWKTGIVTTVFWVGEPVGGNNFVHNCSSSWDAHWEQSYGGFDNPNPEARRRFIPAKFVPRQNPFYLALPYNDVTRGTTKPEARQVIPWFNEAFHGEGQSVCRDRWVCVRSRAGRVAYAQWSDCGPFRTDHWQYVFGKEKPKPNLNQGAGLDVSPALRDYLGLQSTDLTDWKFVDFKDVPSGPWSLYGENNTFTQKSSPTRQAGKASAASSSAVLARNP